MACSGRGDSILSMVFPATYLAWFRAAPLKPSVMFFLLAKLMKNRASRVLLVILVSTVVVFAVYRFFYRETTLFERELGSPGQRIAVTCRADGLVYYPYVVVKDSGGLEIARSMIAGTSYEYLKACRNSFPVDDILLIQNESNASVQGNVEVEPKLVRIDFGGRNAFGDAGYIEVPVVFYRR